MNDDEVLAENSGMAAGGIESGAVGDGDSAGGLQPVRYGNPWPALAILICLWALPLSVGSRPDDLTFNSMLDHLLRGQFDVDPRIVGGEGFLRDGHVYAYWGIWCALLRLPLWLVHRLDVDMTGVSCLAANTVAVAARISTVLLIRKSAPLNRTGKLATDLMLVYVVAGGSATAYLKASVFQEVVFWAVAFAAVFVYFAIKGLVCRHFSSASLCLMALCAGLALLTRVSTGIGLMLAFGLLLAVLAAKPGAVEAAGSPSLTRWKRALIGRRFLVPLGILAVCIAATGAVNYFRWGNPLTFANYRDYIGNALWPDRALRLATYGNFNFRRIPIALLYYFFPLWIVRTPGGGILFEKAQLRLFDDIELPPCSFLVTDLLALGFVLFLAAAVWKRRARVVLASRQCAAIAAGLLAPCLLILTAISLTFRYRMEFYPEFDFLAFLGLYVVLADKEMQAAFARSRIWMQCALVISVVASLAALLLYLRAPFGPAIPLLRRGVIKGFFT